MSTKVYNGLILRKDVLAERYENFTGLFQMLREVKPWWERHATSEYLKWKSSVASFNNDLIENGCTPWGEWGNEAQKIRRHAEYRRVPGDFTAILYLAPLPNGDILCYYALEGSLEFYKKGLDNLGFADYHYQKQSDSVNTPEEDEERCAAWDSIGLFEAGATVSNTMLSFTMVGANAYTRVEWESGFKKLLLDALPSQKFRRERVARCLLEEAYVKENPSKDNKPLKPSVVRDWIKERMTDDYVASVKLRSDDKIIWSTSRNV